MNRANSRVGTLVNCGLVGRTRGRGCLRRGNRNEGQREKKEQRAAEIFFVKPELLVCFHDSLPQDGVMLIGAQQRCQQKIGKNDLLGVVRTSVRLCSR